LAGELLLVLQWDKKIRHHKLTDKICIYVGFVDSNQIWLKSVPYI